MKQKVWKKKIARNRIRDHESSQGHKNEKNKKSSHKKGIPHHIIWKCTDKLIK